MSDLRKWLISSSISSGAAVLTIGGSWAMWGPGAALFTGGLCLWGFIALVVLS